MIISKRKYEERIREAVDKAMLSRTLEEEQRMLRREYYEEFDKVRMRMGNLEARIETLEGKNMTAVLAEVKR